MKLGSPLGRGVVGEDIGVHRAPGRVHCSAGWRNLHEIGPGVEARKRINTQKNKSSLLLSLSGAYLSLYLYLYIYITSHTGHIYVLTFPPVVWYFLIMDSQKQFLKVRIMLKTSHKYSQPLPTSLVLK